MTEPDRTSTNRLLRRLARTNPTVAFLATLVVVLAALFAPGVLGAALLLLLAGALGVLLATTWPVQLPATRTMRLVALAALVALAVAKLL